MCARRITASRRSRRAGPSSLRTGLAYAQEEAGVCGRGRSGHGGWPDMEQCGCPDGSATTAGAVADRSLHRGRAVRSVLLPPAVCCAHRGSVESSRTIVASPPSGHRASARRGCGGRRSGGRLEWSRDRAGQPSPWGPERRAGVPGAGSRPERRRRRDVRSRGGPQRQDRWRGRGGGRAFVVEVLLAWPRLSTLCSGGPAAAWASR